MRHYQDSLCPDPVAVGKRRKKKKCESFFGKLRVKREREDRTRVCDRELRGRSRVRGDQSAGVRLTHGMLSKWIAGIIIIIIIIKLDNIIGS